MKNLCSTQPLGQSVLLSAIFVFCITTILEAQNTFPATGNVGIGTATPAAPLDVSGSSIWNGTIRANGSSYSSFALYQTNTLRWALYNHPGISNTLLFANLSGQDQLAITQDGKLGIGTIAPTSKLHVNGAIRIDGAAGGVVGTGTGSRIELSTGGATSIEENWGINLSGNDTSPVKIRNAALLVGYTSSSAGWGTGGNLLVQGNTGIGITSPVFKLDVEGFGVRFKNSAVAYASYTTFRVQGPNYTNGLEIDFFGNNNITSDLNWSYGGGAGSASIVNVNAKPLTFGTSNVGRMLIDAAGNVGIGTFTPDAKLAVKGTVHANEVKVDLNVPGPDYVFANNYQLLTLTELKTYIDLNKHLPEVPSAAVMEANGINLGEMNMLLLRKIEELTLYIIDQRKELDELKQRSVSPDPSGKKIEELTLYILNQQKQLDSQQKEIDQIKGYKN